MRKLARPKNCPAVALAKGDDRASNITRALELISDQIDLSGRRQVFIKPNLVSCSHQLAATHCEALRAVLEFVRQRYAGPIILGEGTGMAALQGFREFGYQELARQYDVELADLNLGEWVPATAYDRHLRPLPVRLARQVVESDFRISVCPAKTHDSLFVTLSLKNMIMGSLFHQVPFGASGEARGLVRTLYRRVPAWVKYSPPLMALKQAVVGRTPSDRVAMHQSLATHHLNLYQLAPLVAPHLAVIDGFQAMEGDGPGAGDPVDWRVAVASTDFVAADCLTTRLMGFDLRDVGYLYYCQRAGLGAGDLQDMEIRGEQVTVCSRRFRPSPLHEKQLRWHAEARALQRQAAAAGLASDFLVTRF